MLIGGYVGETCVEYQMSGFIVGMLGWVGVIYLIFVGDAARPIVIVKMKLPNLLLMQ